MNSLSFLLFLFIPEHVLYRSLNVVFSPWMHQSFYTCLHTSLLPSSWFFPLSLLNIPQLFYYLCHQKGILKGTWNRENKSIFYSCLVQRKHLIRFNTYVSQKVLPISELRWSNLRVKWNRMEWSISWYSSYGTITGLINTMPMLSPQELCSFLSVVIFGS